VKTSGESTRPRPDGTASAARLIVTGRVQGVGFRWFTRAAAESLRLSGWVRNRPDGTVEAELVGERSAVEACIERLRQGPPGAAVSTLDLEWLAAPATQQPLRFEIRTGA
jgi:acylphosphatase